MRLLIKQKLFSWLDSFDVYDEHGNTVYSVKGQLSFGKCLHVYDAANGYLGTVKQVLLTFLPKYEIYIGEEYCGLIKKHFSFFGAEIDVEYLGWHVSGNLFEWDYTITDASGARIATITKELFNFTDTYVIDVDNPDFALNVLMLVIAIDAEKATRD